MNIKKKYDPSPGGEEESYSDMLSPSRTSNTYNSSRKFNPPNYPTVNEEQELDCNESTSDEENNPSVNSTSCTSQESTKTKVRINASSSVKNRPINLKLINRRPTGFIKLTQSELSRDSSLYREETSICQESMEEQLGTVRLRVPAKTNKPANLKIIHRRPTGFIRTPPEVDSSFVKESIEQRSDDDEDDETSTLNSIEEIPGNIIHLHGTAYNNNQYEDCVCVDCPNYTKFQEHNKDQVKEQQEFCRERGDIVIDECENDSETNESNNDRDPDETEHETESTGEEISNNPSNQESTPPDINESLDSGDANSGSTLSSNESSEKGCQESTESVEVESACNGSGNSNESSNTSSQDHSENFSSTPPTGEKIKDTDSGSSHISDDSADANSGSALSSNETSEKGSQESTESVEVESACNGSGNFNESSNTSSQDHSENFSSTPPTGDNIKDIGSGSSHVSDDSAEKGSQEPTEFTEVESDESNENHRPTEPTSNKTADTDSGSSCNSAESVSQDKEHPEPSENIAVYSVTNAEPIYSKDDESENTGSKESSGKSSTISTGEVSLDVESNGDSFQDHGDPEGTNESTKYGGIGDDSNSDSSTTSESIDDTVSTGVPSLDVGSVLVQDHIHPVGSNESTKYIGISNGSGSESSSTLEESSEITSKTMGHPESSSIKSTTQFICDKSDDPGSSKERAKTRKVVTLIEDKKAATLIKDKPANLKILNRQPTGFIKTVQEYDIQRRKKLKGPARFAFQCDSFIIRDYWKKSKPAIKSIPVGGPPPPLPKRIKRK